MRVLVCGSRHFNNYQLLEETLDGLKTINTIIHGMAKGADSLGGEYAKIRGIPVLEFPALWNKYGNRAGPIRNAQMLKEGQPDLVVAFLYHVGVQEVLYGLSDSQYNRGTKNMIKQAQDAGIQTLVVDNG